MKATNGGFYGTTSLGGTNCAPDGCGTIFEISPAGTLSTLYSFCAQTNCTDGYSNYGGLVQATDGSFYGTTFFGCVNDTGTIFRITPNGNLTTLHDFCSPANCADGEQPAAGLLQATNGVFYGTAWAGGTSGGYGTIFSLDTGLNPFVETLPNVGKHGANVRILGNSLAGTTSVTFNGTPATFTVVSRTQIKTTVPTVATTGIVEVTNPDGTIKSNVPFHVLP